ncbi:MAG: DUF167 domain-containing protein [Verrucomicrobiales bacterium]|jgi:uncharacterized protein (TIGR00251 family)|nr:DUF167 domain-containing protein [Verrucomicrobiales bacterium]
MLSVTETPAGLTVSVQLTPRASRDKILKIHNGALKIAIQAPPVDNAANTALVSFLAKTFALSKRDILIVSGHTAKRKSLALNGLSKARLYQILADLMVSE